MSRIAIEAELVFEQNEDFEFTLKMNRFGQSGHKLSPDMVNAMFSARVQKVSIVDPRGNELSKNF